MKRRFSLNLLAVLVMLLMPILACAQTVTTPAPGSQWSGSYYYDLKTRENSAIVIYNFKTLTNLFGNPKFTVDLGAFGGATLSKQAPIGGFLASKSFYLASGISGTIGLGYSVVNGKIGGVGGEIGLSVKF